MNRKPRQLEIIQDLQEFHTIGDVERWAADRGLASIVGVDEAGRGPLAGPVAAAAVCLPPSFRLPGIDDSKRLTEKQRERLFPQILERADGWGIAFAMPDRIDALNILGATKWAMLKAIALAEQRSGLESELWLIDGNQKLASLRRQRTIIDGDRLSIAIACASVVAKVLRDRWMCAAATRWPDYAFERHKGYGTRAHLEALAMHGPCPIHRKSFAPVRRFVSESTG